MISFIKTTMCICTLLLLVNQTFAVDCKASDQCATCDTTVGSCVECWPNYALQGGKCTQPSNGVKNCRVYYNNDVNKCAMCQDLYIGNADDTTCTTGNAPIQDYATIVDRAVLCNTNCEVCKTSEFELHDALGDPVGATYCLLCKTGFSS